MSGPPPPTDGGPPPPPPPQPPSQREEGDVEVADIIEKGTSFRLRRRSRSMSGGSGSRPGTGLSSIGSGNSGTTSHRKRLPSSSSASSLTAHRSGSHGSISASLALDSGAGLGRIGSHDSLQCLANAAVHASASLLPETTEGEARADPHYRRPRSASTGSGGATHNQHASNAGNGSGTPTASLSGARRRSRQRLRATTSSPSLLATATAAAVSVIADSEAAEEEQRHKDGEERRRKKQQRWGRKDAEGQEEEGKAGAATVAAKAGRRPARGAAEGKGGSSKAADGSSKKPPGASTTAATLKLSPNQLRFVCFGGYALVLLAMYGISPFFQSDAQRRVGMAPSLAGLVFAEAALTSMLATPVAAQLCKAMGRYPTLYLGYAVSISANIGFGLADSVPGMVAFRALQGVAMGLVAVASMTLLIAGSPNIVADMGLQELVISVTLTVAPVLGGALYSYLPPHDAYTILTLPLIAIVVGLTAFLLPLNPNSPFGHHHLFSACARPRARNNTNTNTTNGIRTQVSTISTSSSSSSTVSEGGAGMHLGQRLELVVRGPEQEEGEQEGELGMLAEGDEEEEEEEDEERSSSSLGRGDGASTASCASSSFSLAAVRVWTDPTVALIALAITLTFASQGFLALSFGVHTRNVLGLSSVGAGLFFSTFNIPYALMGLAMGPLSRICASKTLITHGLLLEAGGLLLLGPPPPLLHSASDPANQTSTWPRLIAAWVMTVLGMMCTGTGQGLIAMPAVDAMRTTILERQRARRVRARHGRRHRGEEEEEEEVDVDLDGDEEEEEGSEAGGGGGAMDEELASIMSFTISLGAFAGPMLGGLGIQYLPKAKEWGCPVQHPPDGRFGIPAGAAVECVSGYRWTTLVLSALTFVVWGLLYAHTRLRRGPTGVGGRKGEEEQEEPGPASVAAPLVAIAVDGGEVGDKESSGGSSNAAAAAAVNALGVSTQGDCGGYGHFFVHEEEQKEEDGHMPPLPLTGVEEDEEEGLGLGLSERRPQQQQVGGL